MSTHTQILYHIVYSTKYRKPVLEVENRIQLFQYISGVLNRKGCHLYQIGGMADHLHIVTHVHPSIALADLIKDVKLSSSRLIKEQNLFSGFKGWQESYGAFTFSIDAKDNLINYVRNQEDHHKKFNFIEEYKALLLENNIDFDEKYLI